MFTDWTHVLTTLDVELATDSQVRAWLVDASQHKSAIDGFMAVCAARVGEASAVRGATRCTQREADQAVARGSLIADVPQLGSALATGAISGAHVDALAKAAERTSPDAVAGSDLLAVAEVKPADAMAKQITDFIRTHADDKDEAARLARQRDQRRAILTKDDMGVLHAEFDDTTYGQIRAAINAEADRLYHQDGGRDGGAGEARTPAQRRADAVASLILGHRAAGSATPAVRNQMTIVVYEDGSGHIPGVGPLPKAEIERLMCISDIHGLVFSTDGQPLWLGDTTRLATDDQWIALVARDGGCIGCNLDPSRCEAHHIKWARNNGPTDIDNLALVCRHHHHLIHEKGWQLVRQADNKWTLAPP